MDLIEADIDNALPLQCSKLDVKKKKKNEILQKLLINQHVWSLKADLIGYLDIYIPNITGNNYRKNVGKLQPIFLYPAC